MSQRTISVHSTGSASVRMHEGREHLVVPVVAIVEGVLNESLLLAEEFGRYVDTWNNRPVPVLHPEENGRAISANWPDVVERSIGKFFNAKLADKKLVGEIWIDVQKAEALGHADIVNKLKAGEMMEVSTGYFCDFEEVSGTHNGREYKGIDRNIRPDHLALLPGEVGACSIEDGCGTPRVNKETIKVKIQEAFQTLSKALGLRETRANSACNCEDEKMDDLKQKAEALKANGALTAKQYSMLMEMDEEQRMMLAALIEALGKMAPAAQVEDEAESDDEVIVETDEREKMATNIDKLVAQKVEAHLRRAKVTDALVANSACPFTAEELAEMPVTHLEKLEKSLRPADYSGRGGFATNSDAVEKDVQPLRIHRGITRKEA